MYIAKKAFYALYHKLSRALNHDELSNIATVTMIAIYSLVLMFRPLDLGTLPVAVVESIILGFFK